MSKIDEQYQQIVDGLAEELLHHSQRDLLEQPDYGILNRLIGNRDVAVGFWHYTFDDEKHHVVFKTRRWSFWPFYRSYISGVVFGLHTPPRLMTPSEVGDYD